MNPFFPEIKKNFGFGYMRLPMNGDKVDIPQTTQMVDTFLARGFNYFDTAHGYIGGQSETALRECLTSRYPRDRYVLTNKLSGNFFKTTEEIRPLFELQLKQCGVTYFDFYLMHALNAKGHKEYQRLHCYEIAQELKAEGKIRHVGISFHDTADVLDQILTDQPEIEVVQIQYNYVDYENPKVQSRKCYEVCRKHGKPVIVMEPVKGGSLVNLPEDAKALMTGGSPASYAIRFAASPEGMMMVLSGMSDMAQMEDNLSYMQDFQPLNEAELEIIDQVRMKYQEMRRIPCTGCRYCVDGCPAGILIPDLFNCLNQLRQNQGNPEKDYEKMENKASACLGCGQCEAICPQELHIRDLLKTVADEFED